MGRDDDEAASEASPAAPTPLRIGGRYDVLGELGRGGMACVYRVTDLSSGRELALKQLTAQAESKRARESAVLFEREFHTLAQLEHPRVIEVYDYGVADTGPYYTMELLDGGDLRERTPLAWREACELIYDVCSSLALLHSRRLVHRDVSPRNVRCTRDGHAKLIDFGAMVPMGVNTQRVGTPPFVAPEVVHGAALDARTDLYSLGNTLYYALTGRLAYPARDFSQLLESWQNKPLPPSAFVPEVPQALDRLIASLISLEAALRPRSAFEVMERLAAIANLARQEALSVSKAYLATPTLVGREDALAQFYKYMERALHGRGRGLSIAAPSGLGRTRMLDACVLDAKVLGARVLRAGAAHADGSDFATARALACQLLEVLPDVAIQAARDAEAFETLFSERAADAAEPAPANDTGPVLKSFARPPAERPLLQRALLKWFTQVGKQHALLIAVDDAERVDDGSLAWLAALAERTRSYGIVVVAAFETTPGVDLSSGLEVLASRCGALTLRALTASEVETLLGSVFGDVPNLALLGARIHDVAAGNPRQTMELAQLLVDRGTIKYDAGAWSLPEQLSAADLPADAADVLRTRAATLAPLARRLLECQVLAHDASFTRADYALLAPDVEVAQVDHALGDLASLQLLQTDGRVYSLAQRSALDAWCAELDAATRAARELALAELYIGSGRSVLATVRHLLLGGDKARAIGLLLPLITTAKDRIEFIVGAAMSLDDIGETLASALDAAIELGNVRTRDLHELRRWMILMSVVTSETVYWRAAPEWKAQLTRDSGLDDWCARTDLTDAGQRLMAALQAAAGRYAATPEAERAYPPDEAIRLLVHYVVVSIAVGARTLDAPLLMSLPEILEPFAPLSPLLAAIWQNALATRESSCLRQPERARGRWVECYENLGKVPGTDPYLVASIRYAIAFGVGMGDAALGVASASDWADILDHDPLQKVNAMYMRKIVRLSQGDLEGAERCRKQAELLALAANTPQMFTNLLAVELVVHAAAWDLTGVKQIQARLAPLAERHEGWRPFFLLGEALYERLRGDPEAARDAYERCLAIATPQPDQIPRAISTWLPACAGYTELLITLDRAADAKKFATDALLECEKRSIQVAGNDIHRALALAEAKLGDYAAAVERLDALIERQRALGVIGLALGATYEARARVGIWADDRAAVEKFGKLTAEQFRHGLGSPLGARYERLMDEARGAGVVVLPPLSPFETTIFGNTEFGSHASALATITRAMDGASDSGARARRALAILCEARGARAGHLFLAVDKELKLTASNTPVPPDDLLLRLVKDFWGQQTEDADMDTAVVSDDTSGSHNMQIWKDRQDVAFRPVLLTGTLKGVAITAGVALLTVDEAHTLPVTSMQLVAELARFLVLRGDSQSLRPQ